MSSNVYNATIQPYIATETANDSVATGSMPSSVQMTITPNFGYIIRAQDFTISGGEHTSLVSTEQNGGYSINVLYEKGKI